MTEPIYHPKGGMCANCGNYELTKCAQLPFKDMPQLSRYEPDNETDDATRIIVRCTDHEPAK